MAKKGFKVFSKLECTYEQINNSQTIIELYFKDVSVLTQSLLENKMSFSHLKKIMFIQPLFQILLTKQAWFLHTYTILTPNPRNQIYFHFLSHFHNNTVYTIKANQKEKGKVKRMNHQNVPQCIWGASFTLQSLDSGAGPSRAAQLSEDYGLSIPQDMCTQSRDHRIKDHPSAFTLPLPLPLLLVSY